MRENGQSAPAFPKDASGGPKRGYAIIIRQALKRWRGPRRLVEMPLRFRPFRFSFLFFSFFFFYLQLSTNHFILTILVWNGFHSDRFARRSPRRFDSRAGPFTEYSVLISNLKSQIFNLLLLSLLISIIDFRSWEINCTSPFAAREALIQK